MFGANYDLASGVALCNLNDVSASPFIQNLADFAVEPSVWQGFLLGRVNFDDDAVFWFVLVQELGKLRFTFQSERFLHEAAGSRAISF